MSLLGNAIARTNAKVRYAILTMEELARHSERGGAGDFERAHQESFLFHFHGIKDALLKEIAVRDSISIDPNLINASILAKCGVAEAAQIVMLENDSTSWLANANALRHHSTHEESVPRMLFVGGSDDRKVFFKNPKTGETINRDQIEVFHEWLTLMLGLIEECRHANAAQVS